MGTELATTTETALAQHGSWTRDQIDLIKRTVAKGTSDDEFKLFLYQAVRTGLDPLAKQIYAVMRGGRMAIQTGIDGFRLTADRTGKYAGSDDTVFSGEGKDLAATVTVYKIVQNVRCPFTATARWSEYYPGDAQGSMWKRMPHTMLGKCAEALALRKAFPADLSGVYTADEMAQADRTGPVVEVTNKQTGEVVDVTPSPAPKPIPETIPPETEKPSMADEIMDAARQVAEKSGAMVEQVIYDASWFQAPDRKNPDKMVEQSFTDPYKVKSEKWLGKTLGRIRDKITTASVSTDDVPF